MGRAGFAAGLFAAGRGIFRVHVDTGAVSGFRPAGEDRVQILENQFSRALHRLFVSVGNQFHGDLFILPHVDELLLFRGGLPVHLEGFLNVSGKAAAVFHIVNASLTCVSV